MLDIVVNSLYTNKDVFLREVCMRPAALSAWICLANFCPDSINPAHCDCVDCSFISRFASHFASTSSHVL